MKREKLLNYLDDHTNPYLIKEVRQMLSSSIYPWFLVIILLAMLCILSVNFFDRGNGHNDINIKYYFNLILVSSMYISIALGYIASWRQGAEAKRDMSFLNAYQYPRQMIWGRAISLLVQNGMILLPLLPFFSITSILPGVSTYQVLEALFIITFLQLPFMGAVVFIATVRGNVKSMFLLIIYLQFAIFIPLALPELISGTMNYTSLTVCVMNTVFCLLAIKYFLIFLALSALNTGLKIIPDRRVTWMMVTGWLITPVVLLSGLTLMLILSKSMMPALTQSLGIALCLVFVECGVSFLVLFPVISGIFARE
jgi:hypothetical protein